MYLLHILDELIFTARWSAVLTNQRCNELQDYSTCSRELVDIGGVEHLHLVTFPCYPACLPTAVDISASMYMYTV